MMMSSGLSCGYCTILHISCLKHVPMFCNIGNVGLQLNVHTVNLTLAYLKGKGKYKSFNHD
jgi:hypothetical protein